MRRTLLALIAALALLSGCAGDDKTGDGIATAGEGKTSASADPDEGDIAAQTAKYASCMRENGVDMPDPEVDDDGRVKFGGPAEAGAEPADREKVQAAQEKCKQYLPNGGEPPKLTTEELDQMRKFSQCMRENGYPDFPDPQPDGGIRIEGDQNSDMDPDSQKWKDAHKKCEEFMPQRPGSSTQKTDGGS
ncbi:hypothetical protein [Virgisporangium aurantiacum]|uniref:Lipoprotein n=1 Tax=Virgisporangium aurantiacum TaxID=175570 RepID=A0A8J3Z9K2_9ACTN|nr:hypothetical protein [Virgisporangium aurantiacum]GIJ59894.1 hypothetical protein Vau01_074100 [Virgisporangium aurantiacum]